MSLQNTDNDAEYDYRFGDTDIDWLAFFDPHGKALAVAKDFDESKHPRDDHGRWTDAGGGEHPGEGYSKQAYEDKNGVIHTSSVYDATLALSQNRKVELNQPKQVSMLLHHLGQVAKGMALLGEKAPNFNLCNVSVKGTNLFCAESKGIPRVEMPQMTVEQTKEFIKHLKKEGYTVEKDREHAANLRATQNELNGAKVAKITGQIEAGERSPDEVRIVISKDDYILDGHHRWAADVGIDAANGKLRDDKTIKVSRVNIKITKLLEEAERFTGGKGHKGVEEKRVKYFDQAMRPTTRAKAVFLKFNKRFAIRCKNYWRMLTDDELAHMLTRFNPHHEPAGSPEGGQFSSGDGGGSGAGGGGSELHGIKLTPDESVAVKEWLDYQTFEEINYNLRTNRELTNEEQKLVDDLSSAIDKSPLPKPMTLYRGFSEVEDNFGRNPGKDLLGKLNSMKVGDVYVDRGFTATSTGTAATDYGPAGTGSGAMMVINAPAGTKVLRMPEYQSEWVIQKGTHYVLTSKGKDEFTFRIEE